MGLDVFGMGRILLYLLPELGHENPQRSDIAVNGITPNLISYICMGQDLPRVSSKLTSGTYKTNDKTVGAYMNYLCRSFLFYPIQRYDIKGKRYLESDKKYCLSDLAFRFSEIGTKNADYGHLYENIVAIELLRDACFHGSLLRSGGKTKF